jgi:hypothetical protein
MFEVTRFIMERMNCPSHNVMIVTFDPTKPSEPMLTYSVEIRENEIYSERLNFYFSSSVLLSWSKIGNIVEIISPNDEQQQRLSKKKVFSQMSRRGSSSTNKKIRGSLFSVETTVPMPPSDDFRPTYDVQMEIFENDGDDGGIIMDHPSTAVHQQSVKLSPPISVRNGSHHQSRGRQRWWLPACLANRHEGSDNEKAAPTIKINTTAVADNSTSAQLSPYSSIAGKSVKSHRGTMANNDNVSVVDSSFEAPEPLRNMVRFLL